MSLFTFGCLTWPLEVRSGCISKITELNAVSFVFYHWQDIVTCSARTPSHRMLPSRMVLLAQPSSMHSYVSRKEQYQLMCTPPDLACVSPCLGAGADPLPISSLCSLLFLVCGCTGTVSFFSPHVHPSGQLQHRSIPSQDVVVRLPMWC